MTPDVVIRYETSERARDAIKIFGFLQETPDCSISTHQFACMRAYLAIQIMLDNGNRADCILNLTHEHVEKAVSHESTGRYIYSVII